MINKLTTEASTGRLIKRSVKFMEVSVFLWLGARVVVWGDGVVDYNRRAVL
jgi:hypothetical protein